jgi:acyl carrier protein
MNQFETITDILAEILDLDPAAITPDTYVIRDLRAESIDLLEIGVAMQHRLGIEVDDDTVFLKNMRTVLVRADKAGTAPLDALRAEYPHLDDARLEAMLIDMETGPVLKVSDLAAYVSAMDSGLEE